MDYEQSLYARHVDGWREPAILGQQGSVLRRQAPTEAQPQAQSRPPINTRLYNAFCMMTNTAISTPASREHIPLQPVQFKMAPPEGLGHVTSLCRKNGQVSKASLVHARADIKRDGWVRGAPGR